MTTKIPAVQLEYLESERFEEFPAPVFVRGFLRSYARELRLDADAILEAYKAQTGDHTRPVESVQAAEVAERAPRRFEAPGAMGRIAYGAALALIVLGLALSVLVFGGDRDEPSASYKSTDFGNSWQTLPEGATDWGSSREN